MRAAARRGAALLSSIAVVGCAAATSTPRAGSASGPGSGGGGAPQTIAAHVPEGDWLQFNYDAQRSGAGPANTGITARDLRRLRVRVVRLPGTVDSSVIELHAAKVRGHGHDVLLMTTTYGRTLAIDARTGKRLWEFTPRDIGSYQGGSRVTTATPTADPSGLYIYATTPDGFVHKLAVADGHQLWATRLTFLPSHEKLASPPTVSGNLLIVVTDGYFGDAPPYQGHIATLSLATGHIEHLFNTLCSNRHFLQQPSTCPASDSAIWGRAGAVLVPGSGDILVTTSNGPFNGSTNWGDSVLELTPSASALLHNWTPTDQQRLEADDLDVGSTSPALLPDPGGPPLLLQGGKAGVLDLLDLDRLDGTTGPAGPRAGGQLQELSNPGHVQMFTAPAVSVRGGRTYAFVADGAGTTEYVLHAGASPRLSVGWSKSTPGTSPVLAGGLLYVYDPSGGAVDVRDPSTGRLLRLLAAAPGHWNSPIVVGGRVVQPVGNYFDRAAGGKLYIWHLPGR